MPNRSARQSPLSHKRHKRSHKKAQNGVLLSYPRRAVPKMDFDFRISQIIFCGFCSFFWCLFVANLPVCGKGCSRLIPAPFLSTPGVQRSLCRDRDYNSGDKRPHCSTSWAQACPDIGPPASARYRHPPANDKRDSSSPASHLRQRVLPSLTPPHALKSLVAL